MNEIIEIKNLTKKFKEITAVDNLSFKVKKGELFAFLGVNGAGKSTTISIMCGVLSKDYGSVIINGNNIDNSMNEVSKDLGVVFQNSVLDSSLSVMDNLLIRASLYGITGQNAKTRINELAELLDFKKFIKKPVGKLSGGQRRRIDVARAIIHKPKILILDEPTTGLDPQTRKILWNVIDNYRKKDNMTIFLTTHYMEEAADADYVIILDNGKITAEGTPLDLKNKYTGDYVTLYNIKEEALTKMMLPYEKLRDGYRVSIKNTSEVKNLITTYPELFVDFEVTKGKMDDVFLSATGKKLTGGN